jgi:phage baseplate assembly protein V
VIPTTTPEIIRDLYHRIAELDRRLAGMERPGKVAEVDPVAGTARVELGRDPVTGAPFLSPPLRWAEAGMGGIKTHTPPTVGEQVVVRSPSGDIADGYIAQSVPTTDNKRPSDKGDEHVLTKIGGTSIVAKDGRVHIKADKIVLEGNVYLGGENGAKLVHRKGDADSDGDVAVGSASKVFAV